MRRCAAIIILLSPLLAACSSTGEPPPAAAAPQGPPPISGWLAGPVGQQLEDADRERAFAAEITAADTGKRASWRGVRGNFGVVEPGPETASCRSLAHTLYIDGRAQRGGGAACRASDGGWRISG